MKKIKEIWKPICLQGCSLEISNYGNVRYSINKKPKAYHLNKYGYPTIHIQKNRKIYAYRIHRLVAILFIENSRPDEYDCINHKDENPQNNHVDNLEWCNRKYNNNYGGHNLRCAKSHSKPIVQYTLDGEIVKEWESAKTASRELGFPQSAINWCCLKKKKYNSCKGFLWRYKDDKSPLFFKKGRAVIKKDISGNIIEEYINIKTASEKNKILTSSITNCINGRSKTAGGFVWEYKNNNYDQKDNVYR